MTWRSVVDSLLTGQLRHLLYLTHLQLSETKRGVSSVYLILTGEGRITHS